MNIIAWLYSIFFPHCIVVACWTADVSSAGCAETYDGRALLEWEARLMEGTLAFEDQSLEGWPFVRQFRCEARRSVDGGPFEYESEENGGWMRSSHR